MKPNPVEPSAECLFAWVVGIFEGEGSIYPAKRKRRDPPPGERTHLVIPRAQITSTDRDVLERVRSVLGYGAICRASRRPNQKQAWYWDCTSYRALSAFYERAKPYLCSRRRGRFEFVLNHVAAHKFLKPREPAVAGG
jgi:hypothetical protein